MNLAYGESIQVQDGKACTFLEEGTSSCCTRSSVGRREIRLLEVEDFGKRQALGGGDCHDGERCTFLDEGTSRLVVFSFFFKILKKSVSMEILIILTLFFSI